MEKRKFSIVDFIALYALTLSFLVKVMVVMLSMPDVMSTQLMTSAIAVDGIVLGFYFISSKQSSIKDETIKSMQEQVVAKPTVKADVVNADNVEVLNSANTSVAEPK